MKINYVHQFNQKTREEFLELQNSLKRKINPYNKLDLKDIRELPLILKAAKKITVDPDVFMFDGNGLLHYNKMGIASHASFFLKKPTKLISDESRVPIPTRIADLETHVLRTKYTESL